MAMENITLRLSSDLIQKVNELTNDAVDLQTFITDAIAHEIERRQKPKVHQNFWDTVSEIRAEMESEGIDMDPDAIWADVRDTSPGREVIL